MKNPMQKLRRFFVRPRTFNVTATRTASQTPIADDDGSEGTRLSSAFIVVLILHIVAVAGVFAFARIKENRKDNATQNNPAPTASPKNVPPKPPAPTTAASFTAANPPLATHDVPKPPAITTQKTHIVKDGETLTKIAAAFSVAVPDLVSTNKLKNQDDIHAGQTLIIPNAKSAQKIPVPATNSKTAKTYIVRKGDSPMKIARDHNCTYEELMKLNGIKDPKKIQTGQVLKLPVKNG
jgi:LysM repeat protein